MSHSVVSKNHHRRYRQEDWDGIITGTFRQKENKQNNTWVFCVLTLETVSQEVVSWVTSCQHNILQKHKANISAWWLDQKCSCTAMTKSVLLLKTTSNHILHFSIDAINNVSISCRNRNSHVHMYNTHTWTLYTMQSSQSANKAWGAQLFTLRTLKAFVFAVTIKEGLSNLCFVN